MSARLFDDVFTFVYSYMAPSFTMEKKRREDEVTRILADLLYPGQLSKSHLKTIGTQSSWPQLIAMLDWLCQSVSIATDGDYMKILTTQGDSQGFVSHEDELNHRYQLYNQGAYIVWLNSGQNVDRDAESARLAAILGSSENTSQAVQLQQLHSENQRLLENLPPLESCQQRLAELVDQRCSLEADRDRLRQHAENLAELNREKQCEADGLVGQRYQIKQRVQLARDRVDQLKRRINNQEMSSADVERISRQCADIRAEVVQTSRETADLCEEISATEMAMSECRSRLDNQYRQLSSRMTSACHQLQLNNVSPAAANVSQLLQLRLRGTPDNMTAQLKEAEQLLQCIRRDILRSQTALETTNMQLEKQLRELRAAAGHSQLRQFQLESKLRRIEDQERSDRRGASDKQSQLEQQLVQVNDKIVELQRGQQNFEAEIEEKRARLINSTEEHNKQVEEFQLDLEKRKDELANRLMLALDYKSQLESTLSTFTEHLLSLSEQHQQSVSARFSQLVEEVGSVLGDEQLQALLKQSDLQPAAVSAVANRTVDVDIRHLSILDG